MIPSIKKVLVTGGAGFIGSNLVDALILRGYQVICVDNESAVSNEKFYWNPLAENHKVSILDADTGDLFRDVHCVFHMAAESRIQTAIADPRYAYTNNIIGTYNVVEWCKKHKVSKLVYSSTSSVYGNNILSSDTHKVDCLNPYSVSKYAGEQIVSTHAKMGDFQSCIFRYFNVYGERSPTKGSYAPVVGIFLNQYKNDRPLTIVGSGFNTRDFVHVSDIVEANILAMNTFTGMSIGPLNIGTGKSYSIKAIANMICKNHIYIPARIGEAASTWADIYLANSILGYTPRVDIETWIQSQL